MPEIKTWTYNHANGHVVFVAKHGDKHKEFWRLNLAKDAKAQGLEASHSTYASLAAKALADELQLESFEVVFNK